MFERAGAAIVGVLAMVCVAGCRRTPSEVAPVQNGTYLMYGIQQATMGNNPVDFEVKLKFSSIDDDQLRIDFDSTRGSEAPITVDRQLNPEDRQINAWGLGRLWIPSGTRRQGAVTDCGRTDKQRPFNQWTVWDIQGNCGRSTGARYYDIATGMLVGFQVHIDGKDLSGVLKESR